MDKGGPYSRLDMIGKPKKGHTKIGREGLRKRMRGNGGTHLLEHLDDGRVRRPTLPERPSEEGLSFHLRCRERQEILERRERLPKLFKNSFLCLRRDSPLLQDLKVRKDARDNVIEPFPQKERMSLVRTEDLAHQLLRVARLH